METAQQAGERIYGALYGKVKNKEDIILEIAVNNNLKRRGEIAQYYRSAYDKVLYEDIKSKIGGDFGEAACQLFLSPLEFCIANLKDGIKEKDDVQIFEMITSKNQDELKLIEDAYFNSTGKVLRQELDKIYKDVMKKNVLNIFTTPRSTVTRPNKQECERYANTLVEQGDKKWAGDENIFKEIFLKRSPEELVIIARFYLKKTGKNFADAVEKISDKKQKTLIKEILYNNIMPHEIAADKMFEAIDGLGTNEKLLSRQLVARSELDMPKVKEMYQFKHKKPLKEDIKGDTSASYQQLCLYLSEK